MANEGAYGSLAGMGAGAATGAFGGPIGMAIGAGLGASLGGGIGSIFSKPQRMSVPDISAELARIRALYEEQARVAAANIKQMGAESLQASATEQASKGIYRAPVSAAIGSRIREATSRDIATSNANIGAASAGTQASALAGLMKQYQDASQYNAALALTREQDLYKNLGSLGTSLLSYGMQAPQTGQASSGPYYGMQPRRYSAWQVPGYQIPPGQQMESNLIPASFDPNRVRFGRY